jgi:hypothetical protein
MDLEIIEGFKEESNQILGELETIIETLEEADATEAPQALTEFAQKIDRIMGAAKTLQMESPEHLGFMRIGKLSEICKKLGYSAAELNIPALLPVFAGFWADTLEAVAELVDHIEDEKKCSEIAGQFAPVLQKRLEWLSGKITTLAAAAGKSADAKSESQEDIDQLLKDLGV